MIPPFNDEGILPRGRYLTTPEEIERRFVMTFPASITRKALYAGWMDRRAEVLDIVAVEAEWINGSFVTAKRNAGDIDIVTFVHENDLTALAVEDLQRLHELTNSLHAQLVFGCDSYLVAARDENSPQHAEYLAERGYWDRWWSKYDNQPDTKGYLEVTGQ